MGITSENSGVKLDKMYLNVHKNSVKLCQISLLAIFERQGVYHFEMEKQNASLQYTEACRIDYFLCQT